MTTDVQRSKLRFRQSLAAGFVALAVGWGAPAAAGPADDLLAASARGDVAAVRTLLGQGADVNVRDRAGLTALMLAAEDGLESEAGRRDVVETLLAAGAEIDARAKSDGATALIIAAQHGHATVVQALLDRRAAVNAKRDWGHQTALYLAAFKGYGDVVRVLLAGGADVNAAEIEGGTPLIVACQEGHADVVRALLAASADLSEMDGDIALQDAARNTAGDHLELAQALLAKGVEINPAAGFTPLMWAASSGDADTVRELLDNGAKVDAKTDDGFTAMTLAANDDVAAVLQEAGAKTRLQSLLGRIGLEKAPMAKPVPELLAAAKRGDIGTVQALLAKGADVNAATPTGGTALMAAAAAGHLDIVRALLAKGADVDARDKNGWSALMRAAKAGLESEDGRRDVAEALLAAGAAVDAKTTHGGATAIMIAALHDHAEMVQALVARHASINARTTDLGETALTLAAYKGHADVVRVLLAAGADVNAAANSGKTALIMAAQKGHFETVRALLAAGADVKAADRQNGNTALIAAADILDDPRGDHVEVVQALLAAGADVNAVAKDGTTPLINSCFAGTAPTVRTLLERGARVDARTNDGETPLTICVDEDSKELLEAAGAKP